MTYDTEKITINLGVVELAQIDVLVEQGIYSNRSDFIRTCVRKQLDVYKERIENQLLPSVGNSGKKEWLRTIGIQSLSKKFLERCIADGVKLNVNIIGMLIIGDDVTVELFNSAIESVVVRGKLIAPDDIKEAISKMN